MKKVIILVLALGIWLGLGHWAYGMALSSFTQEFPDQQHYGFVVVWGHVGGPFAAIVEVSDYLNGIRPMYTPYTCEQRRAAFQQMYPELNWNTDGFNPQACLLK